MALEQIQSKDPRYTGFREAALKAKRLIEEGCREQLKKTQRCERQVEKDTYTLVYPSLLIEEQRNNAADAGSFEETVERLVGRTCLPSHVPPIPNETWFICLFHNMFKNNALMIHQTLLDRGGSYAPDGIQIPQAMYTPQGRGLAMLFGDLDKNGLLDFSFILPSGAVWTFLSNEKEADKPKFRSVDVWQEPPLVSK